MRKMDREKRKKEEKRECETMRERWIERKRDDVRKERKRE